VGSSPTGRTSFTAAVDRAEQSARCDARNASDEDRTPRSLTIVLFAHKNWREAVEFYAHCSMKWATFLLSLKEFVEAGKGRPAPADVKIDNWN